MTAHRALTVVLYGVTLAGVFTLALSSFTYFDFWWYLKSGELIVSTQSIPATDPFSFTAQGRPWINHMWATQVLFFALWKIGGRLPLILLKAGVVGGEDMLPEAAYVKLMWVLAHAKGPEDAARRMTENVAGEIEPAIGLDAFEA